MARMAHVQFGDRFTDALRIAARQHSAQSRKSTAVPYVSHVLGVASIAIEFGATEDEAIGALLHDTIEDAAKAPPPHDTAASVRQLISEHFGPRVLAIVEACTDADVMPKPRWPERKRAYVASVAHKDGSGLLVSASDKLHNSRAILFDVRDPGVGLRVFDRFNKDAGRTGTLWYYRALVEALGSRAEAIREHRVHKLVVELDRTVTTLESEVEGLLGAAE